MLTDLKQKEKVTNKWNERERRGENIMFDDWPQAKRKRNEQVIYERKIPLIKRSENKKKTWKKQRLAESKWRYLTNKVITEKEKHYFANRPKLEKEMNVWNEKEKKKNSTHLEKWKWRSWKEKKKIQGVSILLILKIEKK